MTSFPPPHHPPPTRPEPRFTTWQVLTAIGIGSFLGVVAVCGGGVAITAYLVHQQINAVNSLMVGGVTATNVAYSMQVPDRVEVHQPFEIEITIENTDAAPQELYSIMDYSGLTFVKSDPPWQSSSGGELVYQMTLPPGQPQTIKLTATIGQVGTHSLNLDAHMDPSGWPFAEAYHTIEVDPAAAASDVP